MIFYYFYILDEYFYTNRRLKFLKKLFDNNLIIKDIRKKNSFNITDNSINYYVYNNDQKKHT